MTDTTPSIESDIESFNERHQVTTSQQLRQLAEEVGELNQAINESQHAPFVAIEAADVAFVALSIASLYSDEPMRHLEDVAYKNSLKRATMKTKRMMMKITFHGVDHEYT